MTTAPPSYSDISLEFTHRGLRTRSTGYTSFDVLTDNYDNTGIYWSVTIHPDCFSLPSPTDPTKRQYVSVRYHNGVVLTEDELADVDIDDNPYPVGIDWWVFWPYMPAGTASAHRIFTAVRDAAYLRSDALDNTEPEWDEIEEGRRIGRIYRDCMISGNKNSGLLGLDTARQRIYDLSYDPHRPEKEDTFTYVDDDNREFYRRLFDVPCDTGNHGMAAGWSALRDEDSPLTVEERLQMAYDFGQKAGRARGFEEGHRLGAEKGSELWAQVRDLGENLADLAPTWDLDEVDELLHDPGDIMGDHLDDDPECGW